MDVAHARIVDGARRVSIARLQGTVTHLWKVDGGYVLGRRTPRGHRSEARTGVYDLVHVTSDGTRRAHATALFVRHNGAGNPYQVVRCTLSGHCDTVGPAGATRSPYVLATRRNS